MIAEGLDMGEDKSVNDLEEPWAGDVAKILQGFFIVGKLKIKLIKGGKSARSESKVATPPTLSV